MADVTPATSVMDNAGSLFVPDLPILEDRKTHRGKSLAALLEAGRSPDP